MNVWFQRYCGLRLMASRDGLFITVTTSTSELVWHICFNRPNNQRLSVHHSNNLDITVGLGYLLQSMMICLLQLKPVHHSWSGLFILIGLTIGDGLFIPVTICASELDQSICFIRSRKVLFGYLQSTSKSNTLFHFYRNCNQRDNLLRMT